MKQILSLLLLSGLSTAGFAQTRTLAGKLRYANNTPAAGWLVRACNEADLSDRDGSFSLFLTCPGWATLTIQRPTEDAPVLTIDSVRVLAGGVVVMPPFDTLKTKHLVATKGGYRAYVPPPVNVEHVNVRVVKTTRSTDGKRTGRTAVGSRVEGKSMMAPPMRTTTLASPLSRAKPLIEPASPGSRMVITSRDIERTSVRDVASPPPPTGKSKSRLVESVTISDSRTEIAPAVIPEPTSEFRRREPSEIVPASTSPVTKATAGRLTSGEVNDFSKWELWTGVSGKELLAHSKSWNLRFTDRYTVRVKSADGAPQANILVVLKAPGSDEIRWQARTDNTGTAELWYDISWKQPSAGKGSVYAEALVNGTPFTLQNLSAGPSAQNILQVAGNCNPVRKLDISFIVDATGSMQDEIDYLKAEIEDILKKTADSLPGTDIRTASVFYRDLEDDYVVKSTPFTAGVTQTQRYIAAQSADGGGDTPEAVDLALDENLNALDWREDAHRLTFLVLDAPPHNTPAIQQRLYGLIRQYAARGIRLIPVVCSGVDKPTEALMRNMALATNGTYVFLTDHSGIGDSHISPTTDKYDVTYLNNLLYQIIYQFAYMPECVTVAKGEVTKVNQDLPGEGGQKVMVWSYYPNPTTGVLNVRYEETKGHLYITDVSGRALLRETVTGSGTTTFDLSNYPSGIYFLRFEYGADQFVTGRFVVSH